MRYGSDREFVLPITGPVRPLLAAAARALPPRIPKSDLRAVEQARETTPRWKTALVLVAVAVSAFVFGRALVWLHNEVPGLMIVEVAVIVLAWRVRRRRGAARH